MTNKYESWKQTPLKDWVAHNHLNLSAEQIDNVEKHLYDLNEYNNIKDGKQNWKEYLEDNSSELEKLFQNNENGAG